MKKFSSLRMLPSIALFLTIIAAPYCFAGPHGGFGGGGFHGGGGGFHGGGGGFHGGGGYHGGAWGGGGGYHGGYQGGAWGGGYRGGGWGGGYHGANWGGAYRGGWGGWHGGYYPWRGGYGWGGGYWGYPGWGWGGWGFGIGVSFGWGGYWPADPYYAYAPAYPPYYPCTLYYPYAYCVSANDPPAAPAAYVSATSNEQPAPAQFNGPESVAPARPPNVTVMNASYRPGALTHAATSYRPPSHASPQLGDLRPEVRNVILALRGMPPAARARQIASGRYSNLSPQELEFVRYAANVPASE